MHPDENVKERADVAQGGFANAWTQPHPYELMEKQAIGARYQREHARRNALETAARFYPRAPIAVLIEAAKQIEKYLASE